MEDEDRQLDDCLVEAARAGSAATPPAPDRRQLADRAKRRAAKLQSGQRGRLRLRLAETAVVLFLIGGVMIVLVPWMRSRMQTGDLPTAPMVIDPAWASTEGHVIEFTVRYDSWDGYPDYFAPAHPRQVVTAAVDSWLVLHGRLEPQVAGLPLTAVSTSYVCREDPVPILRVQVSVALSDADLVEEMAAHLASQTGYAAPTVSTQTMYYSNEYPELLSAAVSVHVDDRSYTFPYDFTAYEAHNVARMLGQRTHYSGHGWYGIGQRFGDCAIHKVETTPDGSLVITTIARELEAEPGVLDAIRHSSISYEPDREDLTHPWRDPVLELLREGRLGSWASQARSGEAETRIDVNSYGFGNRLVPEDKWELLKARQQRLIEEGREQLPPLTDEDWVEIEEWAKKLEEQLPADVPVETGKSWMELGREEYDSRRATKIDFQTKCTEEYGSFPELTVGERSAAIQLAEQLHEVTRQWYAENAAAVYESGPGAEIGRRVRYIGDIPVNFHVTLKCNDAEFADSLREALESVPGLVRPWEVRESSVSHRVGTDDQPPPIIGG